MQFMHSVYMKCKASFYFLVCLPGVLGPVKYRYSPERQNKGEDHLMLGLKERRRSGKPLTFALLFLHKFACPADLLRFI